MDLDLVKVLISKALVVDLSVKIQTLAPGRRVRGFQKCGVANGYLVGLFNEGR